MVSPGVRRRQAGVGALVLALGLGLGGGAWFIPSEAGYAGVGPDFLPWLVAMALVVCGSLLLRQALQGGFKVFVPPAGAAHGDWVGFAWVSAGLLLNAALITRAGFILSCTLCFVLAMQGLRGPQRATRGLRGWLTDAAIGTAIAAPVYWLFTKALAINLPGLTGTGWI